MKKNFKIVKILNIKIKQDELLDFLFSYFFFSFIFI